MLNEEEKKTCIAILNIFETEKPSNFLTSGSYFRYRIQKYQAHVSQMLEYLVSYGELFKLVDPQRQTVRYAPFKDVRLVTRTPKGTYLYTVRRYGGIWNFTSVGEMTLRRGWNNKGDYLGEHIERALTDRLDNYFKNNRRPIPTLTEFQIHRDLGLDKDTYDKEMLAEYLREMVLRLELVVCKLKDRKDHFYIPAKNVVSYNEIIFEDKRTGIRYEVPRVAKADGIRTARMLKDWE